MGLKVDGVAGFCVAKLDLSMAYRASQDGNRLRTGLRTGVGGVTGPDRGPLQSQSTRESTMEKVYGVVENDKFKIDELQGMIERLEIASEPRRLVDLNTDINTIIIILIINRCNCKYMYSLKRNNN